MASPLSPLSDKMLNAKSPLPIDRSKSPLSQTTTTSLPHVPSNADESEINWDEGPSSPFVSEVVDESATANMLAIASPLALTKLSPKQEEPSESTVELISRERSLETPTKTPFNILEDETCTFHTDKSSVSHSAANSFSRSSSTPSVHEETTVTTHFRQESQTIFAPPTLDDSDLLDGTISEEGNIDDTCFSTFSQVPNTDMTAFARLGQSPTRQLTFDRQTPRPRSSYFTPGTARSRNALNSPRSASPTPRRSAPTVPQYQDSSDTTNLLLDFTQQFESVPVTQARQLQQRSPNKRSPTKQGAEPNLLSYLHSQRSPVKSAQQSNFSTPTPKKTILNLLDFELPPAPTPRSMPSITIRELESVKSKYSSEISSLRATLSGREAEVEALKRAVSDAERRVGEATELTREERSKREYAEKEKEEWERRGRDFENVLKDVREQVMESENERTAMVSRTEEAEERAKDAESRAADAEARAIEAASKIPITTGDVAADGQNGPLFTAEQVQKQIDDKVHALSTELHAIYKKKHVSKVAGLKQGFETKTKEKTKALQAKVEELERRNEELQTKMDATLSTVFPADLKLTTCDPAQREEELKKLEEQNVLIERQKAKIVGREEEIRTAKAEFASLMKDLERERVEKGELVAAVDEMLALQADITTKGGSAAGDAVEDFKKSIGIGGARPTGLRGPGFGVQQSRIGAPAGLSRSTSGGKSRMMSNIERMGSGRPLE